MDVHENRFLQLFSPEGREQLVRHLIYQDLEAGEYLFREGDAAEGLCLVVEGQIEVVKVAGPREHHLADFHAGDYLGEVAVLDGQGRSTDARARTATSVAWVPAADLFNTLLTEPVTLTLHLFQNILGLLRRTNDLYIEEVVHKEKQSLIGEMAGTLMHDLRNPVQVILSSIDLMRIIHPDDETVDCCNKMQSQCDRLMSMAGELLEFSRGDAKLHLVRTDTTALLAQFRAYNDEAFRPVGISIVTEDDPAEIEVDAMRLQRVLQNLVSNAVQSFASKIGARVDLRAWVSDSVLNLSVRDNGPGLPPAVLDRLFQPFVTYGKSGGTGLGLAIVHNVVTAHRGKITVQTQAGQGTEFLIRLPQDSTSRAIV
jgi:signal transduction histidine kinase